MFRFLLCFILLLNFSHAHKLPPEVQLIVDEALSLSVDIEQGRSIYERSCQSCHGVEGVPHNIKKGSIPYLADQTPKYLLIHMAMFKTKHRINSIMNSIAKNLSVQDMANLKSFLTSSSAASRHCEIMNSPENSASITRGKLLAHKEREFSRADGSIVKVSCTMCHGDNGLMPDEYRDSTLHPDLAGQAKIYLKKQFLDFKSSKRVNAGPMNLMVRDLSKRDLTDLSSYYSSLDRCNN
ncbi:c-type cytochrome [Halobacteriovorax sp. HLS]|uniref:c-type cytochrome n=1 Tax=Halobacteriovorax sp. HLS TaxID=2234000 RepID=UPI000FD6FFEA|nr:c-type cytochrome [Halobacteriovorax sp. HLS]